MGSKLDLEDSRKVTREEAEAKARAWGCPYIETSGKTRHNVMEVYSQIIRMIQSRKHELGLSAKEAAPKAKAKKCTIL